jgi:hypothetical protein
MAIDSLKATGNLAISATDMTKWFGEGETRVTAVDGVDPFHTQAAAFAYASISGPPDGGDRCGGLRAYALGTRKPQGDARAYANRLPFHA